MSKTTPYSLLGCSLLALATACGDDDPAPSAQNERVKREAIETYTRIVHASYEDSAAAAGDLDDAIAAFVADPTEVTLGDARSAWLAAREPYLQTEVYRFYDGPIDNPTDGPEGLINAWPLDEAYIDYVSDEDLPGGGAMEGVINDPSIDITEEELESLNEQAPFTNFLLTFQHIGQ
jgi:putative iron-regulated protein